MKMKEILQTINHSIFTQVSGYECLYISPRYITFAFENLPAICRITFYSDGRVYYPSEIPFNVTKKQQDEMEKARKLLMGI
jgi:hypothetical protein